MRIGYFCTAGYTEVGGILPFLEAILPGAQWIPCFPARLKPAPKIGRKLFEPGPQDNGATGDLLVRRMLDIVEKHHRTDHFDAYVLIDDADCRFCNCDPANADCRFCGGDPIEALLEFQHQLQEQVETLLERTIPVVCFLASPEIETWLVADWERSFAKTYPTMERELRQRLRNRWGTGPLEGFGCPRKEGSCSRKLSTELQEEVKIAGGNYSKRLDGALMLMRIRPEQVERQCTVLFRTSVQHLRRLPKPA